MIATLSSDLLLVVAGLAAGLLGGLVGVGGGVLMVPALVYAASLGQREAIATSLAAIVPMSIAATVRQHRYGNVDLRSGLMLGVLGIVGAIIGATLAELLPERALKIGFALLVLSISARLFRELAAGRGEAAPRAGEPGALPRAEAVLKRVLELRVDGIHAVERKRLKGLEAARRRALRPMVGEHAVDQREPA